MAVLYGKIGRAVLMAHVRETVNMTHDSELSSPSRPTFSIVIPAFDEERYLPKCLTAILRAQVLLNEPIEVIVVDNMSHDRTAAIAREFGARVVQESAKVLSTIRNRGAQEATGRYLAFIDADSVMSENMLCAVKRAMDSGRFVGGGVANMRLDRYSIGIFVTALLILPVIAPSRVSAVMFYTTPEAFRAIGGFDEQLLIAEDLDFGRRLKALGRQRGQRYKNLIGAHVTTSARKMDEFGDWYLVRQPGLIRRALRQDPDVAHEFWYRRRR